MKVVVFTIDKYAYVGKTWWHYFKKFWPDCPYGVVVVGQKKLIRDMPCEIVYVNGPTINFGLRMKDFLTNHYHDHELLLLLMLDYIPKQRVNQPVIAKAEALCRRKEFGHVRLRPYPHPQETFEEDPDFGEITPGSRYSLSLQPGIWEKDLLLKLLRPGESAHHTETRGSMRTKNRGKRFLSTMEHVYMHHNFFRRGEVNPGAAAWCKEHWV